MSRRRKVQPRGTIGGWPFDGPPADSAGAQARYDAACRRLQLAEARMRRAFNAWQKARAAERRAAKALEREPVKRAAGSRSAGPDPELNDALP